MKAFRIFLSIIVSLLIEIIFSLQNKSTKILQEDDLIKEKYEKFKGKFAKKYSKSEEEKRFQNYKENHLKAKALNQKAKKHANLNDQPVFGDSPFCDLSDSEFENKYLSLKIEPQNNRITEPNLENFEKKYLTAKKKITPNDFIKPQASFTQLSLVSDYFDWRNFNAVANVRNQNQCGSCWAFAATDVIQSQFYLYNMQSVELSKQQLVDCDKLNQGCTGGTIQKGLDYILENGVMTEKSYPYLGYEYYCVYSRNQAYNLISFYDTYIIESKIDFMRYVIENYGPVAVGMNAKVLKLYQGGILDVDVLDCDSKLLNHGVLIIGFGIDSNGNDYWIVKNYWGAAWGEKGYLRIAARDTRNYQNPYGICGINSFIVTVKLQ